MAVRPIWRGHLRLALVSCPVALYDARHDRTSIRFNLINPDTGNRIRMITQDAETGDELERRNLIKGYEFRKNQYLLLSNEDLDSVKVESSSVMTVEKFVDADSIDPVYYDAAYHLAPDGDAGRDVYAVLREAIAKTGKVALSRVVISQRERTIALRPADGGLMAHTLYEDRDLNSGQELYEGMDGIKVDPEMVQLATQLVQRQAGKYDASDLEDRYETRLRALIDAKLKGEGIDPSADAAPEPSNVVDLMAALKNSLGQAPEEKPAKKAGKAKGNAPQAGSGVRQTQGFLRFNLFFPAMHADDGAEFVIAHAHSGHWKRSTLPSCFRFRRWGRASRPSVDNFACYDATAATAVILNRFLLRRFAGGEAGMIGKRSTISLLAVLGLLVLTTAGTSQTSFVEGTWIIRDLVLSIFECQHQVCGRIVWLSDPARRRDQCGRTIIWGLQSKGAAEWDGGSILDPNNGTTYQLSATYEPDGTLHARIFKGVPLIGRTEILRRVDVRNLTELCRQGIGR